MHGHCSCSVRRKANAEKDLERNRTAVYFCGLEDPRTECLHERCYDLFLRHLLQRDILKLSVRVQDGRSDDQSALAFALDCWREQRNCFKRCVRGCWCLPHQRPTGGAVRIAPKDSILKSPGGHMVAFVRPHV